jgi:soluble lytic murein transglycosylase-like protein
LDEGKRYEVNVQKAIFPGLLLGIIFLLFMVRVLRAADVVAGAAENSSAVGGAAISNAENEAASASGETSNGLEVVGLKNPSLPEDGTCSISTSYPSGIQQWCGLIEHYAAENGVDPNLISAVMLRESSGKPDAYSKSGAVGLMQVMPRDGLAASFKCKNGPCFADRPNMKELFDPEYNVAYGTRMLAELIQHYGDVREALKAYGPKDVGYYYADLVLKTFNQNR